MTAGTVLAVAGCKGGVGKTTTAINIGTLVAKRRSALVVETGIAASNVCDFLDIGCDPETDPTLHDVLADDVTIEDATYEGPSDLRVLPSGSTIEGFANSDSRRLDDVIDIVRAEYDVVILDTQAGLSMETLRPMAIADGVVLITTPRLSAVRDVKKTAELVERVDGMSVGLVLTQTGTGNAPPGERIAEFLGVELLAEVPNDEAVPHSQDAGRAVVDFKKDAPSAKAFRRIVQELGVLGQPERVTGTDG